MYSCNMNTISYLLPAIKLFTNVIFYDIVESSRRNIENGIKGHHENVCSRER